MLLLKSQKLLEATFLIFLKFSQKQEYLDQKRNDRPVKTASQLQVKKGIYKNSSQAWKNFEPFIGNAFQPLIDWFITPQKGNLLFLLNCFYFKAKHWPFPKPKVFLLSRLSPECVCSYR